MTDSVDKKSAKKKAAGKKVTASSAKKTASKKATPAKKKSAAKASASKKNVSKKLASAEIVDESDSGSKTAKPASKSKAKSKAKAKAKTAATTDTSGAIDATDLTDESSTQPVANKKVVQKAVKQIEEVENTSEPADSDIDDDMDTSDLPSGLSKAPVPYERVAGHYMDAAQLAHFSKKLAEWKQQLMEEVDRTVDHMKDDATNFPDPNDRATQEEEFSLELRTRDRERKLIKKINEAQKRIDDDEYGYCETCGIEIGVNRLEARPTAELCIDCKTLEEIKERQNA